MSLIVTRGFVNKSKPLMGRKNVAEAVVFMEFMSRMAFRRVMEMVIAISQVRQT